MTTTDTERAVAWLNTQQGEMERAIRALVELNSHTPEKANVDRVRDALREQFTIPGLAPEVHASTTTGDHLVFHTGAPGKRTLLVGHHDTVFPPGTFEGMREDGDLLRGPGVLDMKGGLVVVRFALRALAEAGLLGRVPLAVVSVADEETGSHSSRALLQRMCADASAALVFEAGRAGDAIITQRKGTGSLSVTARGRAAHAGNAHHEGVNAIWALALFIDAAQRMTDVTRGMTVNVGTVSGGMGRNTVPELAQCGVDFRFATAEDGRAMESAFREAAARAAQQVPGATVEVAGGVNRPPLVRTPASVDLMNRYAEAARASGLGSGEAPLLGGGSDANTTSAVGVASIDGLGPRGRGFHTVNEFIERATLIPRAQALVRFLVSTIPAT